MGHALAPEGGSIFGKPLPANHLKLCLTLLDTDRVQTHSLVTCFMMIVIVFIYAFERTSYKAFLFVYWLIRSR